MSDYDFDEVLRNSEKNIRRKSAENQDNGVKKTRPLAVPPTFDSLFRDPYASADFKQYLEQEYNMENYEFYMAVTNFKQKVSRHELSGLRQKQVVEEICRKYVVEGGPSEINITASLRKQTVQTVLEEGKYDINVFGEAQLHVYSLLKNDIYPRYQKARDEEIRAWEAANAPKEKESKLSRAFRSFNMGKQKAAGFFKRADRKPDDTSDDDVPSPSPGTTYHRVMSAPSSPPSHGFGDVASLRRRLPNHPMSQSNDSLLRQAQRKSWGENIGAKDESPHDPQDPPPKPDASNQSQPQQPNTEPQSDSSPPHSESPLHSLGGATRFIQRSISVQRSVSIRRTIMRYSAGDDRIEEMQGECNEVSASTRTSPLARSVEEKHATFAPMEDSGLGDRTPPQSLTRLRDCSDSQSNSAPSSPVVARAVPRRMETLKRMVSNRTAGSFRRERQEGGGYTPPTDHVFESDDEDQSGTNDTQTQRLPPPAQCA